jgi:hypothetical protein
MADPNLEDLPQLGSAFIYWMGEPTRFATVSLRAGVVTVVEEISFVAVGHDIPKASLPRPISLKLISRVGKSKRSEERAIALQTGTAITPENTPVAIRGHLYCQTT